SEGAPIRVHRRRRVPRHESGAYCDRRQPRHGATRPAARHHPRHAKTVRQRQGLPAVRSVLAGAVELDLRELERSVEYSTGGIHGLQQLLDGEHGGAVQYDLNVRGYTRRDLGRRLSWWEFRNLLQHLPASGESAYFRARHPNSWWWTP